MWGMRVLLKCLKENLLKTCRVNLWVSLKFANQNGSRKERVLESFIFATFNLAAIIYINTRSILENQQSLLKSGLILCLKVFFLAAAAF